MANRLGEYVVYGEIYNTTHYSTTGAIILRGAKPDEEVIVRLTFTGDCGGDLRGKHIRFQPREEDESAGARFDVNDNRGFQLEQIGPTGTMTASGWVRTMPCAVSEFMQRARLGEPPPTEWKRRLYLEWSGQNGRVVVEMADPIVEECLRAPEGQDDEGEWAPLPNAAPRPADGVEQGAGPEILIVSADGDVRSVGGREETSAFADGEDARNELVPESLQESLDAEAAAIERAIRGEEGEPDEALAEIELMDYLIENEEGTPLAALLGGVEQLTRAEELDDAAAEAALKEVLARLALLNVALDTCDHFSPRDCYRLLVDTLLAEVTVYEELIGTSCVEHITTYEYCTECAAEYEDDLPEAQGEDGSK